MIDRTLGKPADILLVEDNPGDARLAMEAMKEARTQNRLHWVQDGVAAMAFLRKQGSYSTSPRPGMILLDLNLPRKNGPEVLKEIKTDPDLRRIPVAILTISKAEEDIFNSYDLHANCYISKSIDVDQFIAIVKSINHFWLSVVTLPSK